MSVDITYTHYNLFVYLEGKGMSNRINYGIYLVRGFKTFGIVYIPHVNETKAENILEVITKNMLGLEEINFCGKIGETYLIEDKNKCIYKNILDTSTFINIVKYDKEVVSGSMNNKYKK